MAAIDKTYGTKAESEAVYSWIKRHRPRMLRYHYGVASFDHLPAHTERPIINTPTRADRCMVRFCTVRVVIERLHEVYGSHKIARYEAERLRFAHGDYVPTLRRARLMVSNKDNDHEQG